MDQGSKTFIPHNPTSPSPPELPHPPTLFFLQSYKLCLDLKTHRPRSYIHNPTGLIFGPWVSP